MKIHPYLIFDGRCAEAFKRYAEVFGGELLVLPFAAGPGGDEVPPEQRDLTMHASLSVGGELLMGSDAMPDQPYAGIKGCHVSLQVTSLAEARRLCDALGAGGSVEMALQQTFWAAGFAMLTDRFGVAWMINCEKDAPAA